MFNLGLKIVAALVIIVALAQDALASSAICFNTVAQTESNKRSIIIQLPDGQIAINKPNQAIYCQKQGACDAPFDCYGNEPPPKPGFVWGCRNVKGTCLGECYQQPVSDNKEATQKILATING